MPQERKVGGWFVVSLRVHYSIAKAIESDEVVDTLNYAELCDVIRREMNVP
jgi:dihydroneopterin aldolase